MEILSAMFYSWLMPKENKIEKQIEKLAEMVAREFNIVHKNIHGLENGLGEVKSELKEVNIRLDKVENRLDRIENIFLVSHQNQIDHLRDTVLKVVTFIKMPK